MNKILNPLYINKEMYDKYKNYNIKLLQCSQKQEIIDHFMRMDKNDRYLRFNSHVNQYSLNQYLDKILCHNELHHFIGYCDKENILRGVSHLTYDDNELNTGVMGISVEKEFQGMGIGFCLLLTTTSFARDKNIEWITMEFTYNNYKIISWVKRAGFSFKREGQDMFCSFSTHLK